VKALLWGALALMGTGATLATFASRDSGTPLSSEERGDLREGIPSSLLTPSGRLHLPVFRPATLAPVAPVGIPILLPTFEATLDPTSVLQDRECPTTALYRTNTDRDREFYLSRGAYSGTRNSWSTDFEKADRQFLVVLRRLMPIDAYPCENPVLLNDPNLRRFPFLFMVEVGAMSLTAAEVKGLRGFMLTGGFVLIDDFWGSREWSNFEYEMSRVLPGYEIVEVPMDHPIFSVVYPVEEILQVPSINNARRGVYWEQDGYVPHIRGIFDESGRLMMAISWNSDLVDAWEWAEDRDYPWDRSNYAFQVGFNMIVYAMTH